MSRQLCSWISFFVSKLLSLVTHKLIAMDIINVLSLARKSYSFFKLYDGITSVSTSQQIDEDASAEPCPSTITTLKCVLCTKPRLPEPYKAIFLVSKDKILHSSRKGCLRCCILIDIVQSFVGGAIDWKIGALTSTEVNGATYILWKYITPGDQPVHFELLQACKYSLL
jgi:hypothetical protein